MKLTVFGGSGPTGRHLLRLASDAGHGVTAVVRNPDTLPTPPPGITVHAGDVLDPGSWATALAGSDAVLSALGVRTGRAPTTLYSTGTANILAAMGAAGVRRLVALTAAPLLPHELQPALNRWVVVPLLRRFFGPMYDDMARMERALAGSDVDWTVLRPPRLIDRPGTGRYRVALDAPLPRGLRIPRADLALAMLDALDRPDTVHRHLTVAT